MRVSSAWLWVLVAVQVAIPASYYLGCRGEDDERFAWRMFSAVRLKRCSVEAYDGDLRDAAASPSAPRVDLAQAAHASWARSLSRGRTYVIERFLAMRCLQDGVRAATLVRRCQWPSGRRQPEDRYLFDCASRAFTHETRPASDDPTADATGSVDAHPKETP